MDPSTDAPPGATGPLLAALLPRDASPQGRVLAIRRPTVRLGRDASNEVVLDVPSVSATHAEVRLRGGVWQVEDLGSVNGTWVDGEPVHGTLVLAPGSSLRVGSVELVFAPHDRWEDSPPSAPGPTVIMPERSAPAPSFMLADPAPSAWPVAWFVGGGLIILAIVAIVLAGGSR